jgi:hypothetical protein
MKWKRYCFDIYGVQDYRPVKWPIPGPYWMTRQGGEGHYGLVACLPADVDLKEFWPEAQDIDVQERDNITFTERFQKPDWWSQADAQLPA